VEDKIINKIISEAVQMPEDTGFESVRGKIEAQTDAEREQSRLETLTLIGDFSEDKSRRNTAALKRFASIAAAILLTVGLGVSLIAASVAGMANSMEAEDSAASEIILEDQMQENFICDAEENESTVSGNVPSDEVNTDSVHTNTTQTEVREYVNHTIDALKMSLELPADAYVTDRSVPGDFELLELYGMSAAQLEANYKSRNIYYNAVWYDNYADVTEIVVKMTEDKISGEIYNLSKASEEQLEEIERLYLNYEENVNAVVGAKYFDVLRVEHEQVLFFRAAGVVNNRSGRSNHLQYMTIVNGCRIEITLIEHFGIVEELSGEEPENISQQHVEMMEHIISTVRWEKIKNNFLQENRGIIFYSIIAVVGAAAIIGVILMPENRKQLLKAQITDSENEMSAVQYKTESANDPEDTNMPECDNCIEDKSDEIAAKEDADDVESEGEISADSQETAN